MVGETAESVRATGTRHVDESGFGAAVKLSLRIAASFRVSCPCAGCAAEKYAADGSGGLGGLGSSTCA